MNELAHKSALILSTGYACVADSYKQLLDEVFVISRISKIEAR